MIMIASDPPARTRIRVIITVTVLALKMPEHQARSRRGRHGD
jgi:hypothetical protein